MNQPAVMCALVQHPPVFMNIEASIERAEAYMEEASANGAEIVVFPETWLPGYPVWLDYAPEAGLWDHPPAKKLYKILYEQSIQLGDDHMHQLSSATNKYNLYVIIGVHERVGNTLYNSMLYIDPEGSVDVHRKLVPTYTERLLWGMGDGSTLTVIDSRFGKIGGLICWEHWMPLARAAMHANEEVIHIAHWPYVKDLHQLCSRHYAFEGQCFVAASGCTLSKSDMLEGLHTLNLSGSDEQAFSLIESIPHNDDELLLKGGSAVIAPDAGYLLEPVYGTREIVYADIDLSTRPEGHLVLDTNGHYARPDIFNLAVNTARMEQVTFEQDNRKIDFDR